MSGVTKTGKEKQEGCTREKPQACRPSEEHWQPLEAAGRPVGFSDPEPSKVQTDQRRLAHLHQAVKIYSSPILTLSENVLINSEFLKAPISVSHWSQRLCGK